MTTFREFCLNVSYGKLTQIEQVVDNNHLLCMASPRRRGEIV